MSVIYPTDLVRIEQASKITGLRPKYIYNLSYKWYIPVIKRGHELWFSISELTEFNEERKLKANGKSIN